MENCGEMYWKAKSKHFCSADVTDKGWNLCYLCPLTLTYVIVSVAILHDDLCFVHFYPKMQINPSTCIFYLSVCTRLISLYTDTFGIIVSRISYGFVTYQPLIFQVRNLKWLGFRVPLAIVNKAHQANQLYPFAISLIESVRTYERTCEKVK